MISFRFDQTVPHPRDAVFAWHERSGAIRRLTPPFMADVGTEPTMGLRDGSRAELLLKGAPPPLNRWVAEHFDYRPPEAFSDRALRGPLPNWVHHHRFEDLGESTRVRDDVSFDLPKAAIGPARALGLPIVQGQLRRMFDYRHRQLLDDLAFAEAHPSEPLRIAMSGSTGLIGRELDAFLRSLGHKVVPIVRGRTPGAIGWDPGSGAIDEEALAAVDVVVHLAGKPIGRRFTESHKHDVRSSRVGPTTRLAEVLARLRGPRTLVAGSAIGYYGADRQGWVREADDPGDDFLASVCTEWEAATAPAAEAGLRVVNVRTGIVLTPRGGALAQQLPLFRAGVGGQLGDGTGWQSWISIDDIVGIFAHAVLSGGLSGPVNGVAPVPVTGRDFARTLGSVLRRPALVPVPAFGPRLLLGAEGADSLALVNQRVSSAVVEASGYEFRQPTLEDALRHVLGARDVA
ncbi:MAG: TIGR01777 family oxidoreductase [Actinomycetota bacterium]